MSLNSEEFLSKGMNYTCRDCKYFNNDSAWLEQALPGLNTLSSAYGSTRGENGICLKRDIYLSPINQCRDFEKLPYTK